MGFASIGSGSKGNCTLVALGDQLFVVDCGFSLKQTERRMLAAGVSPGDITAIFVTHEHADHIGGVTALSHKYSIPVHASYGTLKSVPEARFAKPFDGDVAFEVYDVHVNPVRVPHDAREPTQFVMSDGRETIGVLSDLGRVTNHVVEQFSVCTHLLMEANHDRQMLLRGTYPERLKRRVGADHGHLSNDQALELLRQIAHRDLRVVIGHVSEQNNRSDILENTFDALKDAVADLQYATQNQGFGWIGSKPVQRQTSFG